MKELGITKGKWYKDSISQYVFADMGKIDIEICKVDRPIHNTDYRTKEEAENNTDLIVDAGNTAQKCGLLPSELLRQRDELKGALVDMVNQFAYRGTYEGRENMHTGGLSALEDAFAALGLSDPITVMDFEAAIKSTESSSEKPNNSKDGADRYCDLLEQQMWRDIQENDK